MDFGINLFGSTLSFGYQVTLKGHDFARPLSFAPSEHSRPEGVDRGLDVLGWVQYWFLLWDVSKSFKIGIPYNSFKKVRLMRNIAKPCSLQTIQFWSSFISSTYVMIRYTRIPQYHDPFTHILGMGQNYNHPKLDGDMRYANGPISSFQPGLKLYPTQTKHLAWKDCHTASEKRGRILFSFFGVFSISGFIFHIHHRYYPHSPVFSIFSRD